MRWISVLVISLVLIFALSGQVLAQTQITVSGVKYDGGTPQVTVIDKDHWVGTMDAVGVVVRDPPYNKGPLNNMSSDTKIVLSGDKTGVHWFGYLTFMDKDGDKILWQIWDNPATPGLGKGKIVAATGKFEGMEGTMDTDDTVQAKAFENGASPGIGKCVEKLILKKPL